jgi:hypothetical protein
VQSNQSFGSEHLGLQQPMRRSLLLFALSLTVLFCFAENAKACSCGPTPNVLESFSRSKNVLVLTATGVQKTTDKYSVDGVSSTRMVVDRVYKGRLRAGDVLTFAQGGGADCIWTFNEQSVGRQYLFYLDEGDKSGRFIGFGCGRSTLLDGAGPTFPG